MPDVDLFQENLSNVIDQRNALRHELKPPRAETPGGSRARDNSCSCEIYSWAGSIARASATVNG